MAGGRRNASGTWTEVMKRSTRRTTWAAPEASERRARRIRKRTEAATRKRKTASVVTPATTTTKRKEKRRQRRILDWVVRACHYRRWRRRPFYLVPARRWRRLALWPRHQRHHHRHTSTTISHQSTRWLEEQLPDPVASPVNTWLLYRRVTTWVRPRTGTPSELIRTTSTIRSVLISWPVSAVPAKTKRPKPPITIRMPSSASPNHAPPPPLPLFRWRKESIINHFLLIYLIQVKNQFKVIDAVSTQSPIFSLLLPSPAPRPARPIQAEQHRKKREEFQNKTI